MEKLPANWIVLSHGCIVGSLSPSLLLLIDAVNTPLLTGPLSSEEISWIASLSSLGAIVGTFIFGTIAGVIGPKRAMTYLAIPSIVYWILIHFGNTSYHLLAARAICGLTIGGMQSGVALYVSEICDDSFRGRLGSLTPLFRNIGVLIGYSVGAVIDYEHRPYVFVFFPIMYLFWLCSLPNTTIYYLQKGDAKKGETSLMYYKGVDGTNEKQMLALKMELQRLQLVVEERKLTEKIHLSDFCNRMALKGIATSIGMSWFLQTTSCFLITNYATLIFEKSGSIFDSRISSIILAVVQIFGGLVSTQLGDSLGRRQTLFISLFGAGFGLCSLTVYSYLQHDLGYDMSDFLWLPIVCLSLIIFISSFGIIALAGIIAVENYPAKIRTTGVVLYSLFISIFAFLADKFFPILLEKIHLQGCFLFFAINCFIGFIFVAFMNETKGKSLDTIDNDDNKLSPDRNNQQTNV